MERTQTTKESPRKARGGKYSQKKPSPRRKTRRRSGKEWLLVLLPAAAVLVVALLANYLLDEGTSYVFATSGTQYYADNASPVPAGSEMKVQDDGTTLLYRDGSPDETSLPIYLDGRREIVVPRDMIYFEPRHRVLGRILHFSHVGCTSAGSVTVSRENKSAHLGQGFLFDGKDFFLFFEPVVVSFNGYEIPIPPLSYVEAVYGGYIMVYNYETGECFMEQPQSKVTAASAAGDYEVSLLGDSVTVAGKRVLLTSRPETLDPVS